MRRKSARNAAKASPEKTAKEVETPPKTRRSRRRKRSPSKSSESEDEVLRIATSLPVPVADTPDTTTKSHPPSDDETMEEPVWKVTSSDDAPQGEIQKLKICLRRPAPDSPDKSKTRRSKSNSHTEDDATTSSEDKSSTRQTRSRGSPFVEDMDEKKGKGKSKGKHKSKIEQSAQLNENETMNIEISENAQVTPQSPSIDKPVDNENDHNKVDDNVIQNVNETAESARITGETGSNQPDNKSTEAVKDTDASESQLDDDEDNEPLSVIKKITVVKETQEITSDNLSSEVEHSKIQQIEQTSTQQSDETSNQQSEEASSSSKIVEEPSNQQSKIVEQPEVVGRTLNKGSEVVEETSNQPSEVVEETLNQQPKIDEQAEVVNETLSKGNEAVEETLSRSVDAVKETLNRPVEAVEETLNRPVEAVEETLNRPDEAAEETLNRPAEAVEETLNRPVESVEETLNRPVESVKETLNRPVESVEETLNRPVESVEEAPQQQSKIAEEPSRGTLEIIDETPNKEPFETCSAQAEEKTLSIQQSEVGDKTLEVKQSEVETDNDTEEKSAATETLQEKQSSEREEVSEVEATVVEKASNFERKRSPIPESIDAARKSPKRRKITLVEENQMPEKVDSTINDGQSEEREGSVERLSPEKVLQKLPQSVEEEHENGFGKCSVGKEGAKDEASREVQIETPPIDEDKGEEASSPDLKRKSSEHVSATSTVRRRLIRTHRVAKLSSETSPSPPRVKLQKRFHKWDANAELPSLSKIDLEVIQTFWPTIEFPEEPDLNPEPPQLIERRRSQAETLKKTERKVSVEYRSAESPEKPTTPQEIEDNSNIIAFNRKISIVDDTAGKLKPPPSPAKNPTSEVLFITNLVRPFTLKQLKELLERTGKIKEEGFWTDRIKSKCYVNYENAEEAEATRNALHGVQWPIGNGKKLIIDFATVEDLEKAKNPPTPPVIAPTPVLEVSAKENLKPAAEEKAKVHEEKKPREVEKRKSDGPTREWDIGKKEVRRERSRSRERNRKHRRTPSPIEDFITKKQRKSEEVIPQKLMDDLFLKTKATPSIYWQPLSPEEISTKQQQRMIRMEEHKRRMEESSRMKPRDIGRGPAFRRRYD